MRTFLHATHHVSNRGEIPAPFINELVTIFLTLPDSLFAVLDAQLFPTDIYSKVRAILGPWEDMMHRRAAMVEVLAVLAMLESSCNWEEGVDRSNPSSLAHVEQQEAGAWQVSFDSTRLNPVLKDCVEQYTTQCEPLSFIVDMKRNHRFAVEYVIRLLRVNTKWDGPINRGELQANLSRAAVDEYRQILTAEMGKPQSN